MVNLPAGSFEAFLSGIGVLALVHLLIGTFIPLLAVALMTRWRRVVPRQAGLWNRFAGAAYTPRRW